MSSSNLFSTIILANRELCPLPASDYGHTRGKKIYDPFINRANEILDNYSLMLRKYWLYIHKRVVVL